MKSNPARLSATALALTLTLTLVAAACSDVDSARSASDSDLVANDMDADADMDMDADMGAEHTHDTVEWPAATVVPTITLSVTPHQDGSADLMVTLENFVFQSADGSGDDPGTGHLHVIVDGRDAGMSFVPDVALDPLDPGTHTVRVQLSSPSHGMYSIDGEILAASTEFVIEGETTPADTTIEISVDHDGVTGGIVDASVKLGDTVEIIVDSMIAEEFHLHVYDVTATLIPGETVTFRFVADIPGVFEAELEGASLQILNLEVK